MGICETIPLCPDTTVTPETNTLTEPVEVGPFDTGIVFIHLMERDEESPLNVDVGISPTGYDGWTHHWDVKTTFEVSEAGMHAAEIENFGNWIRLNLEIDDGEATVQAWFTGQEQ